MEQIEGLMKDWRVAYNDMQMDTWGLRQQVEYLQAKLAYLENPYKERMAEIEGEIKALALARAEGVKAYGVVVGYRSGYERVSYDHKTADAVLGTLRDVLPEAAKTLEGARKSTLVSPSVSVKAVD